MRARTSSNVIRVVVATAIVVIAGCSSDDDPSTSESSTTTPEADVCAERDALENSIAGLKEVDVTAEGTNALESSISDVQDDLNALAGSVGDELEPEVTDVQDAVDDLQTAAGDLGSDGGVSDALAALAEVASTSSTLVASLEDTPCD